MHEKDEKKINWFNIFDSVHRIQIISLVNKKKFFNRINNFVRFACDCINVVRFARIFVLSLFYVSVNAFFL